MKEERLLKELSDLLKKRAALYQAQSANEKAIKTKEAELVKLISNPDRCGEDMDERAA